MELESLQTRLKELEAENELLRNRLNLNSSNSSKPPSSDSVFTKPNRSSKKVKGGRTPRGQIGHKGSKLQKSIHIDRRLSHPINNCPSCSSKDLELISTRTKQVFDIPLPKMEITEHTIFSYNRNCCKQKISSPIGEELKQEAQYGPNLKSLVSYLNVRQLIPYKRLTELIEVLYGQTISQGSISNFNKEMSDKLVGFIKQVKDSLANNSSVIHGDETGCMVSKTLQYFHVYSDKSRTLLQGHRKRGGEAINEIGVLNKATGIFVHDRWRAYKKYDNVTHAIFNAHILRDLIRIEENQKLKWATEIKELLLRAKKQPDQSIITNRKAKQLQNKYEAILRRNRPYYQKKRKN